MKRNVTITKLLQASKLLKAFPHSPFLAFSLMAAAVICSQSAAMAQTNGSSEAQSITSTPLPNRLEDLIPPQLPSDVAPPLPSDRELLPLAQLPDLPRSKPEDNSETFRVDRIKVVGSTVFSSEKFATVTAPFVGRELTFAELLQARDAVTKLYVDSGYVTTGALIEPQTIKNGVVTIQVVEGSLQEIKVTGSRRLQSVYIRDRVRLCAKTPSNMGQLLESLHLLRLLVHHVNFAG